jgi:glutamate-1-semialdehyde 2,1-aminomutase
MTAQGSTKVNVGARYGRRIVGESENSLFAIADSNLPGGALGGYAIPQDVRFVAARAEGAHLIDVSGNTYIDFVMGAGAMIIGHSHPDVRAAIHRQADRGTHFFSILNDTVLELTREIMSAIPNAEMIAYATTGSEATAYAMRIARAATRRSKILKFEGAYHGNHDYSLVSSAPTQSGNFPRGRFDTSGIPSALLDEMLVAPYNDLDAVRSIVAAERGNLAAIIVEPIQRIISPANGFLQGLRKIADDNEILLIFDEVVTGFRLAYGGAQEYFGVKPDLAAYGKILGGGLALSAITGSRDLLSLTNASRKGETDFAYMNGTLHGNPLASAAGLATLQKLKQPSFYTNLNDYSARLRQALAERLRKHDVPAVIVGEGSLWHVLFRATVPVNHGHVMASDMRALRAFDDQLIQNGIFVLPGVRRLVSAAHDGGDFDKTVGAFDAACSSSRR